MLSARMSKSIDVSWTQHQASRIGMVSRGLFELQRFTGPACKNSPSNGLQFQANYTWGSDVNPGSLPRSFISYRPSIQLPERCDLRPGDGS
jgi:hypothetical protein